VEEEAMNKLKLCLITLCWLGPTACSDSGRAAGTDGAGARATSSVDDVQTWIEDYATAHPGQAGDILTKTPAEIAADPGAQRLLALCGKDQLPVIPKLVWEHGGGDHAWIHPEQSAAVYCVYVPVAPSSAHWQYDATKDHVSADVYVLYPDQNPCKTEAGADQVAKCIGDPTNFEILVDTASLNDGEAAGLALSEAATELRLVTAQGAKVHLWTD
jgi:hypothetical protein